MIELKVYYAKKEQFGSIVISSSATFADARDEALAKYSDEDEPDEAVFSVCTIELPHSFVKQRRRGNFTPFMTAVVADTIAMFAPINIVDAVWLTIIDVRNGSSASSYVPLSASELLHACLVATSDKPDGYEDEETCTSWATTGYNSIGCGAGADAYTGHGPAAAAPSAGDAALTAVPWVFQHSSVLESLFLELTSTAVIQGRLNRKISNPRRQDTWREEYCVLDGRTDRLWLFPFTSDHSANNTGNTNASALRELGISGLGVPSYIPLLSGCKTKAQEAVSVSTHRSDVTSFTVTILDDWLLDPAAAYAGRLYSDQRSYTFRAGSSEKAGKWVSRLSSLHAMLHQPLLPPGPNNLRLYKPVMAQFVAKYTEGECTYLSAAEAVFQAQTGSSTASHFHSSVVTSLAACGGGGTADADGGAVEGPQIPVTARGASHWAGNCMLESIEDCIAVTQQGNSERDLDVLEHLMTFEGMLKNKYLRGYFQKYLANNCTEETLLFWEYAEDYWRAHPYSQQPFTPASSRNQASWSGGGTARHDVAKDVLEALRRQDAVMLASADAVRQWAESLFLTFLHFNAPYQIGCCTVADISLVSATIDNLPAGVMPPYNLFRAVQLSTFSFMKSIFFPDFVAQPNFHRILVAAIHAADRVAMNATMLATCVASDREVPAFDFAVGSADSAPSSSALGPSVGILPAASRRGTIMGLMKGIVSARRADDTGATVSAKEHSTRVDGKNYAARWRTSKLVVFEQVRGTLPITVTSTTTSTAATAASVGSSGGNALYRLRKRGDKRRSVIGDKMKKLRALQNGAVRKIAWLPEWWWDLLPPISIQAELASANEVDRSEEWLAGAEVVEGDLLDERERMLSECTLLDEAEDPCQTDRTRGGVLSGSGGDCWHWISQYVEGEWMPNDMNVLNATMEKVRQLQAQHHKEATSRPDLHMSLLLAKLLAAEEKRSRQVLPLARQGALFLPAGWKASDAKATAESVKKAVIAETQTVLVPATVHYTSTIPRCISQLNVSRGRILLEDYAHLQPVGFHMHGAVAGLGTLIMCSAVRCRYLRPSSKPVGMLMRGFSKRASQFASDAPEPDMGAMSTPPRARRYGGGAPTAAVRVESVAIAAVPSLSVPQAPIAYSRAALQSQAARAPRSEEFSVPTGSGNSCNDWPRQCAALYVCLGVPRIFLVDPVTWIPSACLDLHAAQHIGPSEQYLQSFDIKDKTHCTWQISPEGIDAEDAREAPRRWLLTLSALCLPTTNVVTVVKAGYLQKRGRVNRAFKLRWFVLTTDLKLRYYKDDQIGILKGTIDMSRGKHGSNDTEAPGTAGLRSSGSGVAGSERVVRFDKEIVVTAQSTGRMFTLLAEDAGTAEDWLAVLNDLLDSPLGQSGQVPGEAIDLSSHSGLSGSLLGEGDPEDDEDEGEED